MPQILVKNNSRVSLRIPAEDKALLVPCSRLATDESDQFCYPACGRGGTWGEWGTSVLLLLYFGPQHHLPACPGFLRGATGQAGLTGS